MNANAAAPVSFLPDALNILSGLVARVHGFFSPRQSATVNTADDHAAPTVDAPVERAAALDADAEYDAAMKAREAEKNELDFLADIAPRFNYRLNERRAALVDASEDYEAALYLNSRLPLARRLKVMDALYLAERFNHKAYAWAQQREFEAWSSGYSAEELARLKHGRNMEFMRKYSETSSAA